jgi:hypothetical protein
MSETLEVRKRSFFTTARVIHTPNTEFSNELDWLWINPSQSHQFHTEDEAQSLANLSNHNGGENGMNVIDYPYFVVRVARTSEIERVS